jgi:hypothetical protein
MDAREFSFYLDNYLKNYKVHTPELFNSFAYYGYLTLAGASKLFFTVVPPIYKGTSTHIKHFWDAVRTGKSESGELIYKDYVTYQDFVNYILDNPYREPLVNKPHFVPIEYAIFRNYNMHIYTWNTRVFDTKLKLLSDEVDRVHDYITRNFQRRFKCETKPIMFNLTNNSIPMYGFGDKFTTDFEEFRYMFQLSIGRYTNACSMNDVTFYPVKIVSIDPNSQNVQKHFNIALLLNNLDRYTFERYEPNFSELAVYSNIHTFVDKALKDLCELTDVEYVSSNQHCSKGLQRLELNGVQVPIPYIEHQLEEPPGYCVAYSYLFLECRTQNPLLPFKDISLMIERNITDIMDHYANITRNRLFTANHILQFIRYYNATLCNKVARYKSSGGTSLDVKITHNTVKVLYKGIRYTRRVHVNKRGTKYVKLEGTLHLLSRLKEV